MVEAVMKSMVCRVMTEISNIVVTRTWKGGDLFEERESGVEDEA